MRPLVGRVIIPRKPRSSGRQPLPFSEFRPRVAARDRISHWITPYSLKYLDVLLSTLPVHVIRRTFAVAASSLEETTREGYGAGIQEFIYYSRDVNLPDHLLMPAPSHVLASFMADRASSVSASCIGNWMSGIRAWHVFNGAPWHGGDEFTSQVRTGACRLAPPQRPPRNPVTLEHMLALQRHLDLSSSFDSAVWAVACCAFWGCCRLGELTVALENAADPKHDVLRSTASVAFSSSSVLGSARSMATFHIPWTKTTRSAGATLTFIDSSRCSAVAALRNHLGLSSQAPRHSHLFSYRNSSGVWTSLTKTRFLARCESVWTRMRLLKVDGHSFRIGGATELLVGGVPPHVVAMIGRWKSLAFLSYWRQVSEVILCSFSSCYDTSRFSSILRSIELFHSGSP